MVCLKKKMICFFCVIQTGFSMLYSMRHTALHFLIFSLCLSLGIAIIHLLKLTTPAASRSYSLRLLASSLKMLFYSMMFCRSMIRRLPQTCSKKLQEEWLSSGEKRQSLKVNLHTGWLFKMSNYVSL